MATLPRIGLHTVSAAGGRGRLPKLRKTFPAERAQGGDVGSLREEVEALLEKARPIFRGSRTAARGRKRGLCRLPRLLRLLLRGGRAPALQGPEFLSTRAGRLPIWLALRKDKPLGSSLPSSPGPRIRPQAGRRLRRASRPGCQRGSPPDRGGQKLPQRRARATLRPRTVERTTPKVSGDLLRRQVVETTRVGGLEPGPRERFSHFNRRRLRAFYSFVLRAPVAWSRVAVSLSRVPTPRSRRSGTYQAGAWRQRPASGRFLLG